MKAPLCKLCQTEHYSTQPHGGAFAPKGVKGIDHLKGETAKVLAKGKKKFKRK